MLNSFQIRADFYEQSWLNWVVIECWSFWRLIFPTGSMSFESCGNSKIWSWSCSSFRCKKTSVAAWEEVCQKPFPPSHFKIWVFQRRRKPGERKRHIVSNIEMKSNIIFLWVLGKDWFLLLLRVMDIIPFFHPGRICPHCHQPNHTLHGTVC